MNNARSRAIRRKYKENQIDYASQIKQSVTMLDICQQYGIDVNRAGFTPCTFHQEKTGSMKIYQNGYHCYGCGAHGDVIDFTAHFFGLQFYDAIKKLNDDFRLGLPIGQKLDYEKQKEAARAAYKLRKARDARKRKRQELLERRERALSNWITYDTMITENAPTAVSDPFGGVFIDWPDAYVTALKRIDKAGYEIDEAERKLWEFEREILQK